ncbi:MAG: KpsF/GutQ family sugar-phosphate isomerase [Pseudomonadota bacterium]|nr:KpsF/GutQ family sugar-phosphate isomerase [Pseudomonadota bacterium]
MKEDATNSNLIATAKKVLQIEAEAIKDISPRLGKNFLKVCELCLTCEGRIVVTGMGKSGHIARKIAATLASTGTPAFFVHPAEASHCDFGMITKKDVVIALSNSGETTELITLLPLIKRLAIPLIILSGKLNSTLSNSAYVSLDISVKQEACPLNLTPTASSTAALAVGDALAVTLLESRGFTEKDFALSHPGGKLGRKLLLRIEDLMHTGTEIPQVRPETSLADCLIEITSKGLGMSAITDEDGNLLGIFTDGDLRRAIDENINLNKTSMKEVMNTKCKTVTANMLAAEAFHVLEQNKINSLVVVDEKNKTIGALNIHDLFRAGVM